jgi:peroxiredoxin
MCSIRDEVAELEGLNARIFGISVNDPFSNKAFHEENVLNFPLLCDYSREVVKKYDVFHEDFAGLKGYTAAKRSVFIVDSDGVVRYKWITEDPSVMPNYDEMKHELAKLT